jgi:caffeoyl-CoA O-methyltransferase
MIDQELVSYSTKMSKPVSLTLKELEKETMETMESAQMLSGAVHANLFQILCKTLQAKYALEIGTFTGYSALAIAEGLGKDGKVITCDISDGKAQELARNYWSKSVHGEKIELKIGSALETIPKLTEMFDFVFIDADKINYTNYYELILPKVRSGGILVADNVLRNGEVLVDKPNESTQAIKKFNEHVLHDNRVENVLLTVRDGITIIRKI